MTLSGGRMKKDLEKNEKKEEISRIVGESIQYFGRREAHSNEEIAERLNTYFAQCYNLGQIPTVEDMCLALGITRQTLHHWQQAITVNKERATMIRMAKEVLAAIDAKLVTEGKIPQVTYIFRAKNYFGMRDQQDIAVEQVSDPLGDRIDVQRLQQKYLESAYDGEDVIELPPEGGDTMRKD